MSALAQPDRMSEEEYLAFERAAEFRHEFIDGEIYAMTGASEKHVDITYNLTGMLYGALRGSPCRALGNDMRVRISQNRNYTYPDISVVCGERQLVEDEPIMTLLNPTVIIEVLSPSTEAYDRGKKFQEYRTIDSLQDYVLVSQDQAHVDVFSRREDNTWLLTSADGLTDTLQLPALNVSLPMAEVYEQVSFDSIETQDE